jgi:hypothetical protein
MNHYQKEMARLQIALLQATSLPALRAELYRVGN